MEERIEGWMDGRTEEQTVRGKNGWKQGRKERKTEIGEEH